MRNILLMTLLVIFGIGVAQAVEKMPDADASALYAAAINRMVAPGFASSGASNKPMALAPTLNSIVYISREILSDCVYINPALGCTHRVVGTMSSSLEQAISTLLGSEKRVIKFIKNDRDLGRAKMTGEIIGGGVLVSLGEITQNDEASMSLTGFVYAAGLAAGETRFTFQKVNSQWVLRDSNLGRLR